MVSLLQIAHLPPVMPVLLAPMAGITDVPFRRQIRAFGVGVTVSEMIASKELVQSNQEMRNKAALCATDLAAGVHSVQLAGREAYWMAEGAKMAADSGAQLVDINMGCPAKRVTGGASGSALMRDLEHALSLIEAVVQAVDIPVTLKMRLGWDWAHLNAPELARRAEAAGVQMIAVHGRTRSDFYKGRANWQAVAAVVASVSIPVIVNGDICNPEQARQALTQSGAAGVMIGRGAQGRPWCLAEIGAALGYGKAPKLPNADALCTMILTHYRDMLTHYGEAIGRRAARKHLAWWLEPITQGRSLRDRLMRIDTPQQVMQEIEQFFAAYGSASYQDLCCQNGG